MNVHPIKWTRRLTAALQGASACDDRSEIELSWDNAPMREDAGRRDARGLVVPALLVQLIETGRWKHPGETALARVVPWFEDQLDFLTDAHEMERQSRALDRLADDEASADLFQLVRRRSPAGSTDLPWLDVEHAILIAVCRHAGDDTAIALDYRVEAANPRVVGSDIWTVPNRYQWRTITPTFAAFANALGLDAPDPKRGKSDAPRGASSNREASPRSALGCLRVGPADQ
jgi:hypothetical protein